MVGKTKAPTKAQKRRFQDLQMVGCIACRLDGNSSDSNPEPADIHHLTAGGRRQGHDATIPLCPWHHRGISVTGLPADMLRELKGPSLARDKRAFVEHYGSELMLLEITEQHLARLQRLAA